MVPNSVQNWVATTPRVISMIVYTHLRYYVTTYPTGPFKLENQKGSTLIEPN